MHQQRRPGTRPGPGPLLASTLGLVLASACTQGSTDPAPTPTPVVEPRQTQEPASFAGRTHGLDVTVQVQGGPFGWFRDDTGRCVALDPPEPAMSDLTPQLEVSDAEGAVLATKHGPLLGRPRGESGCDATISIEVPYRDEYRLALLVEGRGIVDPDAPVLENPPVITTGTSQDVVLRY